MVLAQISIELNKNKKQGGTINYDSTSYKLKLTLTIQTLKQMIKKIIKKLFNNNTKNTMPFQASIDLAGLPVVTFYQGEQKINFLLDTGSNNCIIDKGFLKQIKYDNLDLETNISGLEGNKQKTGMCVIKMSYKDREYEFPYVMQDMSAVFSDIKQETGVTINGLLGSNFFNKFKYVLDFNELIAYSKE